MKKKQVILILAIVITFALGFWFGNNHDNHVKVYTVHEWSQPQEK